jgi:hypothetical protein
MDVLVMVRAEDGGGSGRHEALLERLVAISGVAGALELSGESDILLRIRSDSLSESKAAIEAVKNSSGVKSASSFLVIGGRKWQL